MLIAGLTRTALAIARCTWNTMCGNRSILVKTRGRAEHVRILERLVVPLGHRHHHDLRALAEVEERGTDEVADVLDDDDGPPKGGQLGERAGQRTASRWHPDPVSSCTVVRGGADASPSAGGRLIALDDGERQVSRQIAYGALEERRLAGPRRATRSRPRISRREPGAVPLRERVVLGERCASS